MERFLRPWMAPKETHDHRKQGNVENQEQSKGGPGETRVPNKMNLSIFGYPPLFVEVGARHG